MSKGYFDETNGEYKKKKIFSWELSKNDIDKL